MSEPTIGFVVAIMTGVGAVTTAVLGLDPQSLTYAAIGCGIGSIFAPQNGRTRAILLFGCVMCACAVLGSWAAAQWFGGLPLARNGLSLALGIAFHPLLGAIIARIPSTFDAVLAKLGLT